MNDEQQQRTRRRPRPRTSRRRAVFAVDGIRAIASPEQSDQKAENDFQPPNPSSLFTNRGSSTEDGSNSNRHELSSDLHASAGEIAKKSIEIRTTVTTKETLTAVHHRLPQQQQQQQQRQNQNQNQNRQDTGQVVPATSDLLISSQLQSKVQPNQKNCNKKLMMVNQKTQQQLQKNQVQVQVPSSNADKQGSHHNNNYADNRTKEEIDVMLKLHNRIKQVPPTVSSDDEQEDCTCCIHHNSEETISNGEKEDDGEEKGDSNRNRDEIEQHTGRNNSSTHDADKSGGEGNACSNDDEHDNNGDNENNDNDEHSARDSPRIATLSEEQYVMQKLLQRVQAAEDLDVCNIMHSSIINTADNITSNAARKGTTIPHTWKVPRDHKRLLCLRGINLRENDGVNRSKITKVFEIQHRYIRQRIPKRIPCESGEYSCDPNNDLLFTRSQFMKHVVIEMEKQIDWLRNDPSWKVTLSSTNCNNYQDKDESYLLEAEGTQEALDLLRNKTQLFVKSQIEIVNLKRLIDDGESLVVDVSLNIAKESVDCQFSMINAASKGAYISSVHPDGNLARYLGCKEAYERGCAVFKVNDRDIANPTELEEFISLAKMRCGDRSRSVFILKLTLCLSKYADLSEAPNASNLNIRRMDGRLYKTDVYENHRLRRAMEWLSSQKQSRVSKKKRYEEREWNDTNKKGEDEEEDRGESGAKSLVKTKRKRKDRQSRKTDEKKVKRKTINRKHMKSDSDSNRDQSLLTLKDGNTLDSNSTDNGKRTANEGIKRFWHFEKKFKPLIDLDYKDTKINVKKSCSSIWSVHKSLFGDDTCGEDCECLSRLPELSANVIKDHVAQQKKKGNYCETEHELEKRKCGIFQNFAPRFLPLLRKEYPIETSSQLIQRLVEMWPIHQKHRLYGVVCTKECKCEGEWTQIFGSGDHKKAQEFEASAKKRSIKKRASHMCQVIQASNSPVIPRKRKTVPAALPHAPSSAQNDRVQNRKAAQREQSQHANGNKRRKSVSISSREPFEVQVATSKELGVYFNTELLPNGVRRCRVYSKYPNGQMGKDSRILNGTTVLSVITGNTVNKITSHTELKQFYDIAKRSRKTLCIIFENQSVAPYSANNNDINNKNWDELGNWVSLNNDGWDGGVPHKSHADKLPTLHGSGKDLELKKSLVVRTDLGSILQMSAQDILPEWTIIVSTAEPGHDKEPKKSILRTNETNRQTKKVVFSITNESVYFFKHDESNVRRIEILNETINARQISPGLSPEQTLIDAIRNKSCKYVIMALQSGILIDVKRVELVLQKNYAFIGNELKRIRESPSSENSVNIWEQDLNAKYTVLNIYINCINLIEKTMSLKKWYAIIIELRHLDLNQKHSTIDMIGGSVAVKLKNGKDKENLGHLPFREWAQHICYSDCDNNPSLTYTVNNNSSYVFEERDFVIELKKRSHHGPTPAGLLGSFKFSLDDIEKKCFSDGKSIEYIQPASSCSNDLSSGVASITASKRLADKEYIMNKKKEVIKKLHTQLEYIKRFNSDRATPSDARCLTSNIIGINGKSILHAAIQLVDDEDLVEKVLRLGANPRTSSGIGTPLVLAQNNFHRAIEKEKNIENTIANEIDEEKKDILIHDIEVQRQRCNHARVLVDMLQSGITNSFDSSSSAAIPKKKVVNSVLGTKSALEQSKNLSEKARGSLRHGNYCLYCGSEDHKQRECELYLREWNQLFCSHCKKAGHDKDSCLILHPKLREDRGGVRKLNKFGKQKDPDSPRRSDMKESFDSVSINHSQNDQSKNLKIPLLPCLRPKTWVVFERNWRRCNIGNSCKFFNNGRCRYWHEDFSPIKEREKVPTIPPWNLLPVIKENSVKFKSAYVGSTNWWTAAHIDVRSKVVVYAQDLLKCGFVGEDLTNWFRSKDEALDNLRYTLFVRNSKRESPHGAQQKKHSDQLPHHQQRNNHRHHDHCRQNNKNRNHNDRNPLYYGPIRR